MAYATCPDQGIVDDQTVVSYYIIEKKERELYNPYSLCIRHSYAGASTYCLWQSKMHRITQIWSLAMPSINYQSLLGICQNFISIGRIPYVYVSTSTTIAMLAMVDL